MMICQMDVALTGSMHSWQVLASYTATAPDGMRSHGVSFCGRKNFWWAKNAPAINAMIPMVMSRGVRFTAKVSCYMESKAKDRRDGGEWQSLAVGPSRHPIHS